MARSYASSVIEAPVERVWEVVREFDGLPDWHPALASSEIEGARPGAEVGCIRRLTMPDGTVVRERLAALDDIARSYSYEMLEGPFPIRRYVATIRVMPMTDSGNTFVEWYADFDADAAAESDLDATFSKDVFAAGLKGLSTYVRE